MTELEAFIIKYLDIDKSKYKDLKKNTFVYDFLILWSLFEQNVFKGYCRIETIKKMKELNEKVLENIEEDIKYFFNRYQNKKYYKNLVWNNSNQYFENILNKNYENLSHTEKTHFILFVVFRFRNNIFHGNKGIQSWLKYNEQIEKCVKIMIRLLDN